MFREKTADSERPIVTLTSMFFLEDFKVDPNRVARISTAVAWFVRHVSRFFTPLPGRGAFQTSKTVFQVMESRVAALLESDRRDKLLRASREQSCGKKTATFLHGLVVMPP